MMARRLLCSVGLGACLLAVWGCDVIDVHAQNETDGTFERTLDVSGPVDLDVRTGGGNITITSGADDSVHVLGRIRARASWFDDTPGDRVAKIRAQPPIEHAGNTIRIGNTAGNDLFRNVEISYELVVPAQTRVRSQSGSGDQIIGSVQSVDARAGSGDIEVGQASTEVKASTGSGDIVIERTDGSLTARAGHGDIHAGAVGGGITAHTGSGDIDITQIGSGDIEVRAGSGDVTLSLAENAAFTLNAQAGSGSIQVRQPLTVSGTASRHRLQGTVRGGGNRVNIMAGSGAVMVQ